MFFGGGGSDGGRNGDFSGRMSLLVIMVIDYVVNDGCNDLGCKPKLC